MADAYSRSQCISVASSACNWPRRLALLVASRAAGCVFIKPDNSVALYRVVRTHTHTTTGTIGRTPLCSFQRGAGNSPFCVGWEEATHGVSCRVRLLLRKLQSRTTFCKQKLRLSLCTLVRECQGDGRVHFTRAAAAAPFLCTTLSWCDLLAIFPSHTGKKTLSLKFALRTSFCKTGHKQYTQAHTLWSARE